MEGTADASATPAENVQAAGGSNDNARNVSSSMIPVTVSESLHVVNSLPVHALSHALHRDITQILLHSFGRLANAKTPFLRQHYDGSSSNVLIPTLPLLFSNLARAMSYVGRRCGVWYARSRGGAERGGEARGGEGRGRQERRGEERTGEDSSDFHTTEAIRTEDIPPTSTSDGVGDWFDGRVTDIRVDAGGSGRFQFCVSFDKTAEWLDGDTFGFSDDGDLLLLHKSDARYQISVRPVWCQVKGFPWWPGFQNLPSLSECLTSGFATRTEGVSLINTLATAGNSIASGSASVVNPASNMSVPIVDPSSAMDSALSAAPITVASGPKRSGGKRELAQLASDEAAIALEVTDLHCSAYSVADTVSVFFPGDNSTSDSRASSLPPLVGWSPSDFDVTDVNGDMSRLLSYKVVLDMELEAQDLNVSATYKAAQHLTEDLDTISSSKGRTAQSTWFGQREMRTCYSGTIAQLALRADRESDVLDVGAAIGTGPSWKDPAHAVSGLDPGCLVGRWVVLWVYGGLHEVAHPSCPMQADAEAASTFVLAAESAVLRGHHGAAQKEPIFSGPALPATAFQVVPPELSGHLAGILTDFLHRHFNRNKSKRLRGEVKAKSMGYPVLGWVAAGHPKESKIHVVFDTPSLVLSALYSDASRNAAESMRRVVDGALAEYPECIRRAWLDTRRVTLVPLPLPSPLIVYALHPPPAGYCRLCFAEGIHAECTEDVTPTLHRPVIHSGSGEQCDSCGSRDPAGCSEILRVTHATFFSKLSAAPANSVPYLHLPQVIKLLPPVKPLSGTNAKAIILAFFRSCNDESGDILQGRGETPLLSPSDILNADRPAKQVVQQSGPQSWATRAYKLHPGMRSFNPEALTDTSGLEIVQCLCSPCASRYASASFCPVCQVLYDERSTDMICCDGCDAWVHVGCDGMTLEDLAQIDRRAHPVWSQTYICPICRYRHLLKLLLQLRQEDKAAEFTFPVTEEQAPGYFNVIKQPMDLLTICSNLDRCVYDQPGMRGVNALRAHFELIMRNAMVFNTPQDKVYKNAARLLRLGDSLFEQYFPMASSSVYRSELKKLQDMSRDTVQDAASLDALTPSSVLRKDHKDIDDTSAAQILQLNAMSVPSLDSSNTFEKIPVEHQSLMPDDSAAVLTKCLFIEDADPTSAVTAAICCRCDGVIENPEDYLCCVDCGDAVHLLCTDGVPVLQLLMMTAVCALWATQGKKDEGDDEWNVLRRRWTVLSPEERVSLFSLAASMLECHKSNNGVQPNTVTWAAVSKTLHSSMIPESWSLLIRSTSFQRRLDRFRRSWRCGTCAVCDVCGECHPQHATRLLSCFSCASKCHTFCCRPVLVTAPDSPWFCGKCVHCRSCGKADIQGASVNAWSLRADLCRDCQHVLRKTGRPLPNISAFTALGVDVPAMFEETVRAGIADQGHTLGCPVCDVCDTADSVCCDACGRWVHLLCDVDGMGKQSYAVISEFDSSMQYFCALCRRNDPATATQAAREWSAHAQRVRVALRSMRNSAQAYERLEKVVRGYLTGMLSRPKPSELLQLIAKRNTSMFDACNTAQSSRRIARCLGKPSQDKGFVSTIAARPGALPAAEPRDNIVAAIVRHTLVGQQLIEELGRRKHLDHSHTTLSRHDSAFTSPVRSELAVIAARLLDRGKHQCHLEQPVTNGGTLQHSSTEPGVVERKKARLDVSDPPEAANGQNEACLQLLVASSMHAPGPTWKCELCRQEGSGLVDLLRVREHDVEHLSSLQAIEGILLPFIGSSSTHFVHSMCALWSTEVYEGSKEDSMQLVGVQKAVRKSNRVKCMNCGISGASVPCALPACDHVCHFRCGITSGGQFLKDRRFLCAQHRTVPMSTVTSDIISKARARQIVRQYPSVGVALAVLCSKPDDYAAILLINPLYHPLVADEHLKQSFLASLSGMHSGLHALVDDASRDDDFTVAAYGIAKERNRLHSANAQCEELASLLSCNADWRPPVGSQHKSPRKAGLAVLNFGSVLVDSPHFHKEKVIYPSGYHAVKLWWGPDAAESKLVSHLYDLRILPHAGNDTGVLGRDSRLPMFIIQSRTVKDLQAIARDVDTAFMILRILLVRKLGIPAAGHLLSVEEMAIFKPQVQATATTAPVSQCNIESRLRWSRCVDIDAGHVPLTDAPLSADYAAPASLSGDKFFGVGEPWVRFILESAPQAALLQITPEGSADWWPRYRFAYVQPTPMAIAAARNARKGEGVSKRFNASGSARTEVYSPAVRTPTQTQASILAARTACDEDLAELDRVVMGDDVVADEADDGNINGADSAGNSLPKIGGTELDGMSSDAHNLPTSTPAQSAEATDPQQLQQSGPSWDSHASDGMMDGSIANMYKSMLQQQASHSVAFSDRLVVRRSAIHGWGLFLRQDIPKHSIVIEYTGQLVRQPVADRRERLYEEQHRIAMQHAASLSSNVREAHDGGALAVAASGAANPLLPLPEEVDQLRMFDVPLGQHRSDGSGSCYLFRLDDEWIVDATVKGSAARFMNHSCEPNCYSEIVNVDGSKKIVILALRDLNKGEEVTYNYKFALETDPKLKIPCYCGAPTCPGSMN